MDSSLLVHIFSRCFVKISINLTLTNKKHCDIWTDAVYQFLWACAEGSAGKKISFEWEWAAKLFEPIERCWLSTVRLALAHAIFDGGAYLAVIMGIIGGVSRNYFQKALIKLFAVVFWCSTDSPVSSEMPFKFLTNSAVLDVPCEQVYQTAWECCSLTVAWWNINIRLAPLGAIVFTVPGWMACSLQG